MLKSIINYHHENGDGSKSNDEASATCGGLKEWIGFCSLDPMKRKKKKTVTDRRLHGDKKTA